MPKLGRLGFLLAQGPRLQDVGQDDEDRRVFALFVGQLAAGFEIGLVFEVAHGSADFDENHVGVGAWPPVRAAQLDFAGDMGNGLHVAAQVGAFALLFQHRRHDLAVGGEIGPAQVLVQQAFVGPQVHVGFHAVVEDEDFAVAIGVERAGVDVVIAFHLDGGDAQALVLEQLGQRGGENPLAQSAHDGADDDDVFMAAQAIVRPAWGCRIPFPRVDCPMRASSSSLLIIHPFAYSVRMSIRVNIILRNLI